jgi:hypothetical protein
LVSTIAERSALLSAERKRARGGALPPGGNQNGRLLGLAKICDRAEKRCGKSKKCCEPCRNFYSLLICTLTPLAANAQPTGAMLRKSHLDDVVMVPSSARFCVWLLTFPLGVTIRSLFSQQTYPPAAFASLNADALLLI